MEKGKEREEEGGTFPQAILTTPSSPHTHSLPLEWHQSHNGLPPLTRALSLSVRDRAGIHYIGPCAGSRERL